MISGELLAGNDALDVADRDLMLRPRPANGQAIAVQMVTQSQPTPRVIRKDDEQWQRREHDESHQKGTEIERLRSDGTGDQQPDEPCIEPDEQNAIEQAPETTEREACTEGQGSDSSYTGVHQWR